MGQARSLSTGHAYPGQRRTAPKPSASASDITMLRRLLQATRPDLETFGKVLERVSWTSERESSVYVAALRRYVELRPPARSPFLNPVPDVPDVHVSELTAQAREELVDSPVQLTVSDDHRRADGPVSHLVENPRSAPAV
jgi:hypothetical protein